MSGNKNNPERATAPKVKGSSGSPENAKKLRERATAAPQAGVGNQRYPLYVNAWRQVLKAEEAGFYLEAITILESLIGDRMESRASYLSKQNAGFKDLGALISIFRSKEEDEAFKAVVERIDSWRKDRNKSLHEIVKFQTGEKTSWSEKTRVLPKIVVDGKKILKDFDQLDIADRTKNGAGLTATQPNAFA
jgi:hypothetical protein